MVMAGAATASRASPIVGETVSAMTVPPTVQTAVYPKVIHRRNRLDFSPATSGSSARGLGSVRSPVVRSMVRGTASFAIGDPEHQVLAGVSAPRPPIGLGWRSPPGRLGPCSAPHTSNDVARLRGRPVLSTQALQCEVALTSWRADLGDRTCLGTMFNLSGCRSMRINAHPGVHRGWRGGRHHRPVRRGRRGGPRGGARPRLASRWGRARPGSRTG